MRPIIWNTNNGYGEREFVEHLLFICNEHKTQERALAFAFIFYDFENFAINKIFQDGEYWAALDKISGKFLTVFYIDTKDVLTP